MSIYEYANVIPAIIPFITFSSFPIVLKYIDNLLTFKSTTNKRVAVFGLTCLDIHACPVESLPDNGGVSFIEDIHLSLAGTAGGTAVTIAKLIGGNNVDYFGSIGDDFVGKLLINLLETYTIDSSHLQIQSGLPTSATVINVRSNGERPCLHRLGASDHLQLPAKEIQYICSHADIIHIGGMGLQTGMPCSRALIPLLESINKSIRHIIVVMDLIAPHVETLNILEKLLPYVDYFMPSLEVCRKLHCHQ